MLRCQQFLIQQLIIYCIMFQIKNDHEHADFDCHPCQSPENQFQKVEIEPVHQQQKKQKVRKIRIKSLPNQDPNQVFFSDALIPDLEQSIALLTPIEFQVISSRRKNLQLFVYTSLVQDGKDYLARLFKAEDKSIKFVHQMISQTVLNVHDALMHEILQGEHDVHKIARPTKQDIFNNGRTTEAAIKIKQLMLKNKLTDLKADINESNLTISNNNPSSVLNLNSADMFMENSHKTKQAKQFVRRMREMQEQQRKQRQEKQEYKRQRKLQEQAERQEVQERIKNQKREALRKQYQRKREEKQRERKQQEAKNIDFKKFLDQFKVKTPLFKQKQKQFFQKHILPQNNKKLQLLRQIHQDRRPLNHEQLKQHEKQYMQIKQDHIYQKNAARAVQQKSKKPDKNYYKSKFHNLIQKQEKQREQVPDQNQIRTKMYQKRWEYSNQIKTKFIPKIDLRKREEVIKNKEQLAWVEKSRANRSLHLDSYKKDGKDNLQKLHKYIAQLKAKGKIPAQYRTVQSSPQPNSARYKNYLQQLRQAGTNSQIKTARATSHRSIDYSSLMGSTEDAQRVKLGIRRKEEVVARREQYLAILGGKDLGRYMEEKKKVDEDYLQAVKAKMAIINQFQ